MRTLPDVGLLEAGDQAQGRGLAAGGGADQNDQFARGDGQGQVGDGEAPLGLRLAHALEDHLGHCHPPLLQAIARGAGFNPADLRILLYAGII